MKSQTGTQLITINIFPDITKSKDNQTMKFGQLVKYNVRKFFFKNQAENEAGRLVHDLFLSFKKALYEVKAIGQNLSFDMF